jgi:hypothetical protein
VSDLSEQPGCLPGQVIVFDLIGVLAAPSWRELCPADHLTLWSRLKIGAATEAEFWSDEAGRAYRAALNLRRARLDLLARLRARDIAIVIASNFAAAWLPTIRERMPAGLVDRWLVSGELGVAKPAAASGPRCAATSPPAPRRRRPAGQLRRGHPRRPARPVGPRWRPAGPPHRRRPRVLRRPLLYPPARLAYPRPA